MNTVEIFENGRSVSVPSSWDEMTSRQIREVFRIFDLCVRKGLSPLEFNVRVLYMLMGVKRTVKGRILELFGKGGSGKMSENVYLLCEKMLGFLFSPETATLSFDSISNPIPVVRSGIRLLYGPADLLQDLTFGEFRYASTAINRFFTSKDVADLDEAVAFLYRTRCKRANRAGRKVPEITNGNASKHIQRAKRLRPWQKNLVMMWFSACLRYLQTGSVELNGEMVDLSVLFQGDSVSSGVGFGWNDLLVELAKENTLGNMDRVDEEPLFSVLAIMWHNYKERKRNEQIAKASKAH